MLDLSMQIDDNALIQAVAQRVVERLLENRQFVYDVVQCVDSTNALDRNRATIDTMVREMAMTVSNRVDTYVDGAIKAAVERELAKCQSITASFRDKLEKALQAVIQEAKKDLGSTVRRAVTDLLRPNLGEFVDKLLGKTP